MQQIVNAEIRNKSGKSIARKLRREGKIPAVFYGKGKDNLHLAVSPKELEKATSTELGMNALIELKVDNKDSHNVILGQYQAHPIKRHFTHADFVCVDLEKEMLISVPIKLKGRPVGVKEGGILDQISRELQVNCLPNKIPAHIEVDVTDLKIGQNLHLSDIQLPEGVSAAGKENITLATIVAPKEEKAAAETEEAASAEPEVTGQKNEGKDDAAGGDDKGKDKK